MITFQTLSYYLYTIFAALIFNLQTRVQKKALALFVANGVFHTLLFFHSKKHFIVLGLLLILNYLMLKIMVRWPDRKKVIAWFQLIFVVFVLCFFKYSIFNTPILGVFPFLGVLLKPLVFVGISFFSFKMISVVLDLKRGALKQELNFIHYANFVLFFPCFLSGPLDRYDNFVKNFNQDADQPTEPKVLFDALFRIVWGAFKKGVVADSLYGLSIASISNEAVMTLPIWKVLVSLYIYSWLLYIDFSGYSDIAIGISRLFGVRTPENFYYPYFSRNLQIFWNRWHITFMHWLRDYVYFPIQVAMLKKGFKNPVFIAATAFFVVFMVAGVWHGDTLYYTLYGLSHGLSFAVYLVYKRLLEKHLTKEQLQAYNQSRLALCFGIFMTYNYFTLSLLFFLDKWHFWGQLF